MSRKSTGKKVRFEVFKRDEFVCQYCGAHPPAVVLHVDHILPVAEGGTNDITNLITACQPCNAGKGARLLSSIPEALETRQADIEEREAQIRGYNEVMQSRLRRMDNEAWKVAEILSPGADSEDMGFGRAELITVRRFIEQLGVFDVIEAAEIAYLKVKHSEYQRFRYFCGVCWKKIRGAADARP